MYWPSRLRTTAISISSALAVTLLQAAPIITIPIIANMIHSFFITLFLLSRLCSECLE